jgi:hypothetical protein
VSRPICDSWLAIYYCLAVTVLLLWGALSDERTGLSFVYAAGPCQRCLSWVQVPWDSLPYFTVSDLKLPFSSPPMTRKITVEVFDSPYTRVWALVIISRRPWWQTQPRRVLYFVSAVTVCLCKRYHENTPSSAVTYMPSRVFPLNCMYNSTMVNRCHGNVLSQYSLPRKWTSIWLNYSGFQASCHNIKKHLFENITLYASLLYFLFAASEFFFV